MSQAGQLDYDEHFPIRNLHLRHQVWVSLLRKCYPESNAMSSHSCVSEENLRAFLLGELLDEAADQVTAHLEVCKAVCEAAAARLDTTSDPILESLRRALRPQYQRPPSALKTLLLSSEIPRQNSTTKPNLVAYELLEELGRGGMGVVYRARDRRLGRTVALKIIKAEADIRPEVRDRFRCEAAAMACLHHPGIVQIFDVGDQDGAPFLTLEFVPGGTLAQKLRGAPLPPPSAAALLKGLAHAIAYAHRHGVLHRDLTPANVLVAADGRAKITDFGLAHLSSDMAALTQTGVVMGTPSYLSPEQADGQARVTGPATDIYALGAILYECMTGRPPFRGATVLETLAQVVHDEPVSPRQLLPQVPIDLNTICLKCLQKEPHRRYATALELADDLQRFLDGKPVRARPVGLPGRLWRFCRRRPAWAAMLATVGILLNVILIGGSVGLVRLHDALEQSDKNLDKARKADRATQEQLFDALLAQAHGNCLAHQPGQRFKSLAILKQATRLARELELPAERFLQLRNTAILALALPDLYVTQTWDGLPDSLANVDFDNDLAVYAVMDTQGNCEVRRVAGDQLLHRLPAPADSASLGAGVVLSGDGSFLGLTWRNNAQSSACKLQLFRLDGDRAPELLYPEQNVTNVAFAGDNRRIVIGHSDGSVSVHAA